MKKTLEQKRIEEKKKKKTRIRNHALFSKGVEILYFNNREVARLCDVHVRTVERWSAGDRTVPGSVLNFLEACRICKQRFPSAWKAIVERFFGGKR